MCVFYENEYGMCKIKPEDQNKIILYVLNCSTTQFWILLLSDSLILKLENSTNLHIDYTYKITTCNYTVVVVGITDLQKKFFQIAVGVLENETTITYEWIFESLVDRCI